METLLEVRGCGASVVVGGMLLRSCVPPRTLRFLVGGVTRRVESYNAPCRWAGGMVAKHVGVDPGEREYRDTDEALAFKDAAHMKRGLVAWVEREGEIRPGEGVTARLWEQWIYPG